MADLDWQGDKALAALKQGVLDGVNIAGKSMVKDIVTKKLSGGVLNARTGTLRRSIMYEADEDREGVRLRVGVNSEDTNKETGKPVLEYAKIHEFGGTIRPKNAKARKVPLPPALTAKGALTSWKRGADFRTKHGDASDQYSTIDGAMMVVDPNSGTISHGKITGFAINSHHLDGGAIRPDHCQSGPIRGHDTGDLFYGDVKDVLKRSRPIELFTHSV